MEQPHTTPTQEMNNSHQALEDYSSLSYEEAREQLAAIVTSLERGSMPLEESVRLWEQGEALAARCQNILDAARARLDAAMSQFTSNEEA